MTRGLRTRCMQRMPTLLIRAVTQRQTDYRTFQEEPLRCIGPSCVKELAKFFMPTSDEEENSHVNNRTRCKKLFEPKKEEESEK